MCICPQVLGWLPIVKLTQNTWDCLIEYSDSPNVLESEKNAENTKLLHIRNSIAWSCFFREIWVELGLFELGGNQERDGLDCFRCRPALQKSGTAFQVLAPHLMPPIIMSDGGTQARLPLWQILWSNIQWCLTSQHWWHIRRCWWHITEIMCTDQNEGILGDVKTHRSMAIVALNT